MYTSEIDPATIESIKVIEFKEIDDFGESLPTGVQREDVDANEQSPKNRILAMKPVAWGQQGSMTFVVILKSSAK